MKPTYTHTVGVNLSRKRFSREEIKRLDIKIKSDDKTKDYYTGLAGRMMCFAFPSEELKNEFKKEFIRIFG